jgi:glycerol dehydrogenase-like iron-containing ADH family enzyme
MPVDTFFVDSTPMVGPFMMKGEHSLAKGLTFLGRSGIKVIHGLRVAFVSGIDSDLLGSEVRASDPETTYLGNYFVHKDVERVMNQYGKLV